MFRHYEVPPIGGGAVSLRRLPLPVEADTLEKARASITVVKKTRSKLSHMRADPKGPCTGGCPPHAISRAGSNAHVMKTTCMVCGHKTSTPRPKPEPSQSHEVCLHKRTDNRNSTRSVHRVYCLDCCATIEEIPQKLWKTQQGLAEQVKQSPLRQQDLTRRQLEEYNFTKFEAADVVKRFFKHMDKFLVKVDSVTSTELSSFLEDAMDAVREQSSRPSPDFDPAARSSSAAPPAPVSPERAPRHLASNPVTPQRPTAAVSQTSPPTLPRASSGKGSGAGTPARKPFAGMALSDDSAGSVGADSDHSDGTVKTAIAVPEPTLRLVDPFKDNDNVWVMLDEGCNTTCHGTAWRLHSATVLAKHGLRTLRLDSNGGSFKGVGSAKAIGRHLLPFALKLGRSPLLGEIRSVELDSPDLLCLLSLQDQVQLGLVKDLRKSRVRLSGYKGWVELARHEKTGLLLMNVSQFPAKTSSRHRHFLLQPDNQENVNKKYLERKASIPAWDDDHSAYMLGESVRDKGQHNKVRIYTLGLDRLELGHRSKKVYQGINKLIGTMHKGKSYDFTLDNPEHEDTLLKSLRENYDILNGVTDRQILFLDCREMGDPGKDPSLRDHIGTNEANIEHMIGAQPWKDWMAEVVPHIHNIVKQEDDVVLFTFCKSGCHRSVANGALIYSMLGDHYDAEVSLQHICDGPNWKYLCGRDCPKCHWNTGKPALKKCLEVVTETWLKHVPKDDATEDDKAAPSTAAGSGDAQASSGPAKDTTEVTPKGAPSPPDADDAAPSTTSKAKPQQPPEKAAEAKPVEVKKEFLRPTPKVKAQAPPVDTKVPDTPAPATFATPPKSGPKKKTEDTSAGDAAAGSMDTTSGNVGAAALDIKDEEMDKKDDPAKTSDAKKDDPARTSDDKKDDSVGGTSTASSDPKKGTRKLDASDKPVHDLRPCMEPLENDDELEKVVFLYLSRIYSVFNPAKLSEVSTLMAKYSDNLTTLACAVAAKYLDKASSEALFTSLVSDFKRGKRTEHDWCPDLEIANRSLDQAIMQIDEEGGTASTAAGATEPRGTSGSASGSGAEARDRTRSANRVTSSGYTRGKGKGEEKGKDKGGKRGKQTHTVSDPASLTHAETRHDLLALDKDPNYPTWLGDEYLDTIINGHKSRGSAAFKQWLHPGVSRSGPPVLSGCPTVLGWPTLGTSTRTRCGDTTSTPRSSAMANMDGSSQRWTYVPSSGPTLATSTATTQGTCWFSWSLHAVDRRITLEASCPTCTRAPSG